MEDLSYRGSPHSRVTVGGGTMSDAESSSLTYWYLGRKLSLHFDTLYSSLGLLRHLSLVPVRHLQRHPPLRVSVFARILYY